MFISVFVSMLRNYMAYMKVPTAPIKKGEHPELFDKQGFAAETTEDCIVCNS